VQPAVERAQECPGSAYSTAARTTTALSAAARTQSLEPVTVGKMASTAQPDFRYAVCMEIPAHRYRNVAGIQLHPLNLEVLHRHQDSISEAERTFLFAKDDAAGVSVKGHSVILDGQRRPVLLSTQQVCLRLSVWLHAVDAQALDVQTLGRFRAPRRTRAMYQR
jgi:hypothetical protein